MTSRVIYHDFRQENDTITVPESAVILTAPILAKGRRWIKAWAGFNATVHGVCLVLCGACIAVSAMILCHLLLV